MSQTIAKMPNLGPKSHQSSQNSHKNQYILPEIEFFVLKYKVDKANARCQIDHDDE